jgi:hypothetical protein
VKKKKKRVNKRARTWAKSEMRKRGIKNGFEEGRRRVRSEKRVVVK